MSTVEKEIADIKQILVNILKDLDDMKSRPCQIHAKRCGNPIHPTTCVIDIASRSIDETYSATAVRILLPASSKTGERKAITDASLHAMKPADSNVLALGKTLQMLHLQSPKKIIIRTDDNALLCLVDQGCDAPGCLANSSDKTKLLSEDIESLKKRAEVSACAIVNTSPEYLELISLLFEAETEYANRLTEIENESKRSGSDSNL